MKSISLVSGLAALLLLSACSESNTGVSLSDFRSRVVASAGPDAENCGTAAANDSELDQNSCIADAFQAGRAAYALYQQRGIDSVVYSALSTTVDGQVTQLTFDSDPEGGGSRDNGRIAAFDCADAMLSGFVDGSFDEVFVCATGS